MNERRRTVRKIVSRMIEARESEDDETYDVGLDMLVNFEMTHFAFPLWDMIEDDQIREDFGMRKSADILSSEWERDGWIASCEEHLDDLKDEDRDGFADAASDLYCDYKDCEKKADFEIYPDLLERVKETESEEYEELEELELDSEESP